MRGVGLRGRLRSGVPARRPTVHRALLWHGRRNALATAPRGRDAARLILKRLRDPADSLWLLVTTQELEELLDLNSKARRLFAWLAEKTLWLTTNENGVALLQKRAQAFLAIVGVVADVLCRRFTEQCLPHSPLVMLLNCALG